MAVEVPFAEMTGHIPGSMKGLRNRFLLRSQCVTMRENASTFMRTPGEHRRSCWRADWPASVEPFEPQTIRGHYVEVRRFKNWMIPVARLPPTHIVGHHKDDVRLRSVYGDGLETAKQNACRKYKEVEKGFHHELKRLGDGGG